MRATNSVGTGAWSDAGTGTPAPVPDQPTNVVATPGNNQVILAWEVGDNGGSPLTKHRVRYRIGEDGDPNNTTVTADTVHTVTGLVNGTEYQFQIKAFSSAGASGWSDWVTATPSPRNPGKPTSVVATPGNNQVILTWDVEDHGNPLTGHDIEYRIGEDGTPTNVTGSEDTVHTVTGLENGTEYQFRIRAENSVGDPSEWSDWVAATPAPRRPDPPTNLVATPEGSNKIILTWDVEDHGSPVTAHEVNVMQVNGNFQQTFTIGENPHMDVYLTAGKTYDLQVQAENSVGESEWSVLVRSVAGAQGQSLVAQTLKAALAERARAMLDEASTTIVGRMDSGAAGSDVLTAFAGLFGAPGPSGCPLEESLEECMTRGQTGSGDGSLALGPLGNDRLRLSAFDRALGQQGGRQTWTGTLSDLRDLAKRRGFAISLTQPLPGMGPQLSQGGGRPASSSDETQQGFSQQPDAAAEELQFTLWGQGSQAVDGNEGTLFWGMDARMGDRWMTGLALAESGDSVTQSLSRDGTQVSGFTESEVSAVYPYAKVRFDNGLSLWGLTGWGKGRVDSTWTGLSLNSALPEETIHLEGALSFAVGLIGAEHLFHESEALSLSAVGDAGWSQLAVESGTAAGIAASVHRVRIGLQAQYVSPQGDWSSNLRVSGRVDGGDGETGSGAEFAGDVRRNWGRWQAGIEGHGYTASSGLGRWGGAASLGLQARDDGTGLSFSLAPGWGSDLGVTRENSLLADNEGAGTAAETDPEFHLGGRIAWGTKLPGLGLLSGRLTPHAEFRSAQDGAYHVRTGLALEGPVSLGVAADLRKSGSEPPVRAVMLRLDTSF